MGTDVKRERRDCCCHCLCRVGHEVQDELARAKTLFPRRTASAYEGFAVLKEEVDELWDVVKRNQRDPLRRSEMRKEAIQVAAMAVRFIEEVCDT